MRPTVSFLHVSSSIQRLHHGSDPPAPCVILRFILALITFDSFKNYTVTLNFKALITPPGPWLVNSMGRVGAEVWQGYRVVTQTCTENKMVKYVNTYKFE